MAIGGERYVSTTTFRRSGEGVATPTWIVELPDGRVAVWTGSASGKVKRLRRDPRVTLQPCDARGRVRTSTEPVEGRAEVVTGGPQLQAVQDALRRKYGVQAVLARVMTLVERVRHRGRSVGAAAVLITLAGAEPRM